MTANFIAKTKMIAKKEVSRPASYSRLAITWLAENEIRLREHNELTAVDKRAIAWMAVHGFMWEAREILMALPEMPKIDQLLLLKACMLFEGKKDMLAAIEVYIG